MYIDPILKSDKITQKGEWESENSYAVIDEERAED